MTKESQEKEVLPVKPGKRLYILIPLVGVAIITSTFAWFLYSKGFVVAATVNGSPISRLSIVEKLEKQGGKDILDSLIIEKLIASEAQKKNVTVSQSELDGEIGKIEVSMKEGGATLDGELSKRGMTRVELEERIRTQKVLEKLLADKVTISDADVETYITENKVQLPKGQEAQEKKSVKENLKQQKMQQAAQTYVDQLKKDAKIQYFVQYKR